MGVEAELLEPVNGVAVGEPTAVAVGRIAVAVGTGTGVLVAVMLGRRVDVAKGVRRTEVVGVLVGRKILVAVGPILGVAVGEDTAARVPATNRVGVATGVLLASVAALVVLAPGG